MTSNILIITNKQDITSDFIIKELKRSKISFYRFNTEELGSSVLACLNFDANSFVLQDLRSGQFHDLKQFTAVYYRRPELPTIKELSLTQGERNFVNNEIAFTLEGIYKIIADAYWVSPLFAIREAENKIHQLIVARSIGLSIPSTMITNSFTEAFGFYTAIKKNCIIKPIKAGLIEDQKTSRVIFTSELSEFPSDIAQIEACPVFLQSRVLKQVDVRVTVVGSKVFSTRIHSQTQLETSVDWRRGENILKHEVCVLPGEIEVRCVELLRRLGLRFGAIDFVQDTNGEYIFLEINPNGQWAWIEKQTGQEISGEIVKLLLNENF